MEIKLTQGDSVAIPEGCVATIQNGCVVFEPQSVKFKDGDILVVKGNDCKICPFIYAGDDEEGYHKFYVGLDVAGNIQRGGGGARWGDAPLSVATESEAQRLFEQLGASNLRWNSEKKRIEKIRWRAEDGEEYCYVGNQGIIMVDKEDGHCADKNRHEFGNYFRTREQTLAAANAIKKLLIRIHDENTD